jgi:hypothetical protein
MTRRDAVEILTIIQTAYPAYNPPDTEIAIGLWIDAFNETPAQTVKTAVKTYIMGDHEFAPNPGNINTLIYNMNTIHEDTPEELWAKYVRPAIRDALYHSEERFEKFPLDLQKVIAAPRVLSGWASMSTETVDSVIYSQFLKSYRGYMSEKRRQNAYPPEIRAKIPRKDPFKLDTKAEKRAVEPTEEEIEERRKFAKDKLQSMLHNMSLETD